MSQELTRRSFAKWSAAAAAGTAFAGLVGIEGAGGALASEAESEEKGEWKIGGCLYNCSCGSSRCLLRIYTEDGVPLIVESDHEDEDTIGNPQRRACLRGYAQVSRLSSPSRLKYPMKRKSWSPEEPNGHLRGIDEWERISWDEALDIVASQTHAIIDKYGPKSIFLSGYDSQTGSVHLWDPMYSNFYALGAGLNAKWGTISLGAWDFPSLFMAGTLNAADSLSLLKSKIHLLFGCNWAANKGGNTAYHLSVAREQGAKVIIVDPWFNQTAQAVADQWIPIKPGTDAALMIGMMYHWAANGLQRQDYLDKYCLGFDADHMPDGAPAEGNFKDYLLGTYDGEPKTPEWAEKICGVPAADIVALAEEIIACDDVNFFGGQSISKIPAGVFVCQAFWTMAFMHGRLGTGGSFASWIGHAEHNYSSVRYANPGPNVDVKGTNPRSPFIPPLTVVTPSFNSLDPEDKSWDVLECSELWQNMLDGEYGSEKMPGGKRPVDIHMVYAGVRGNYLNQMPNANAGIKAWRSMDFVVAGTPFFDSNAKYADVILPYAVSMEEGNLAWQYNSDTVLWMDRVQEPPYEAKPMFWVAEAMAERLGLDPKVVLPFTDAERCY